MGFLEKVILPTEIDLRKKLVLQTWYYTSQKEKKFRIRITLLDSRRCLAQKAFSRFLIKCIDVSVGFLYSAFWKYILWIYIDNIEERPH